MQTQRESEAASTPEQKPASVPASIDETLDLLAGADYVADRALGTVLFLALRLSRPLFLEGEAEPLQKRPAFAMCWRNRSGGS